MKALYYYGTFLSCTSQWNEKPAENEKSNENVTGISYILLGPEKST